MPGYKENKINYYLNRLVMTELKDPHKIDPYTIIRDFCDFEDQPEMIKLFRKTCKAALSDKYSWKEGSPGNLLYYSGQIELLVEACYLIYSKDGFKKQVAKQSGSGKKKEKFKHPDIPCSLTWKEYINPLIVIEDFFDRYSLMKWKQSIHAWLEAGLSDFTVLGNIKSEDLLPYCRGIEKLLEASYRIVLLADKNDQA